MASQASEGELNIWATDLSRQGKDERWSNEWLDLLHVELFFVPDWSLILTKEYTVQAEHPKVYYILSQAVIIKDRYPSHQLWCYNLAFITSSFIDLKTTGDRLLKQNHEDAVLTAKAKPFNDRDSS